MYFINDIKFHWPYAMISITVRKHDLIWINPVYRRTVILQRNIQGMHDVFHEEQEQEQQQKQTQQQKEK